MGNFKVDFVDILPKDLEDHMQDDFIKYESIHGVNNIDFVPILELRLV
jgi:hypothetical protein